MPLYIGTQLTPVYDSNRLNGELGSFYRDAGNLNDGIVPRARLRGDYEIRAAFARQAAQADAATRAELARQAVLLRPGTPIAPSQLWGRPRVDFEQWVYGLDEVSRTAFSTPGTTQWVWPELDYYDTVLFRAVGGGGAGGSTDQSNNNFIVWAGGGGGGCYAENSLPGGMFTAGDIIEVTIGAGGLGVLAPNNGPGQTGGNGTATTIKKQGALFNILSAEGGYGGVGSAASAAAAVGGAGGSQASALLPLLPQVPFALMVPLPTRTQDFDGATGGSGASTLQATLDGRVGYFGASGGGGAHGAGNTLEYEGAGGGSSLFGGNGGDGSAVNNAASVGGAGVRGGGGGGAICRSGSGNATGGAGGDGYAEIIVLRGWHPTRVWMNRVFG